MGQVIVEIGGRTYPLSCRDGDESHLTALADDIAEKADGLARSLGPMSEVRLLLMSALMVADELHESRNGKSASWSPGQPAAVDVVPNQRLVALLVRAERLLEQFED